MTLKHISGLEGSLEVTRNGTKPATCRLVCPSRCLAVYRLTHAKSYVWINIKVSSDVDLDPVSRCDFIFDWPSLSFRGHRSFWHKLDSSAVTMTATVTIYRTHRKSHTFSVQWRHPPFLDDLGARFKVKPADDIFPREKLYVVKLAEVCALWVLHSLLTWREVNSRQEKTSTKWCCCCSCWRCETTTLYVCDDVVAVVRCWRFTAATSTCQCLRDFSSQPTRWLGKKLSTTRRSVSQTHPLNSQRHYVPAVLTKFVLSETDNFSLMRLILIVKRFTI